MRALSVSRGTLLCVNFLGLTAANTPVFGTERGYDVGGNEALCWETNLTVPNETRADVGSIETLNQELYGDSEEARLRPACYAGTNLTVVPLDLDENRQIITGNPYTFELTLEANITAINEKIFFQALKGKSTIHARLQLCDAIKQGFCNPMWDSRDIENSLTPAQTDLNASDSFPEDNKWKYNEGSTLLGVSKGPVLVFSRWVKWTLKELSANSSAYKTSVDITFQLPHGMREGAYFFIGHAVMQFDLGDFIQRIDVAAALPDNVAEVRNPPKIAKVSEGMKIYIGVVIGIFGSIALAMFVFTVYHREHPAMKLAQGRFLAAMAFACLMQIVCSFFFLPTKDIYCRLAGPLVLIPMTFVGACLVGRVWRVFTTLSTAQSFARMNKKTCDVSEYFISLLTFLANVPFCCKKDLVHRRRSLRQTVTEKQTWGLICILTLPQLVFQVLTSALIDRQLEMEFDVRGDNGRVVCDANGRWVLATGIGYAALVYLIAVFVAWISRSLPSAFNEKDQIFHAATISTVLACMSIAFLEIMNAPTTEPDVVVFLRSVLSIGVAASVMLIIIWPKIHRVLSGEKVVVSTLLGSRFSTSTKAPSSSSDDAQTGAEMPVIQVFGKNRQQPEKRIKLKKDDPLPTTVETKILDVQSILRGVTEKLGEGRPLSAKEVSLLQGKVNALNHELNLVDMDGQVSRRTEL